MGTLTVTFGLAALNGFGLAAAVAAGRTDAAANRVLAALIALVSSHSLSLAIRLSQMRKRRSCSSIRCSRAISC